MTEWLGSGVGGGACGRRTHRQEEVAGLRAPRGTVERLGGSGCEAGREGAGRRRASGIVARRSIHQPSAGRGRAGGRTLTRRAALALLVLLAGCEPSAAGPAASAEPQRTAPTAAQTREEPPPPPPLEERVRHESVVVLATAHAGDLTALAAELDAAVAATAPRVPVALESPLTVVVEPDHVAQAVRAGAVGEAVPGGPADVHLVLHPDDGFAYRHAIAAALLRRAGLGDRPPYLLDGAALWLSGDWYGRPWRDWLPDLAAADVLPTADELLAVQPPPDGSRLLWAPAAAALVDRLPGRTVVEKLSSLARRSAVDAFLDGIASEATTSPAAAPATAPRGPPLPPFLAGVSLAMRNALAGGYHAPSVVRVLDRLGALGANAVSLMPFAFQAAPDAPELRYLNRRPGSETDAGMVHAARAARGRGFVVLWKPQIWLRGSWSGEIAMADAAGWAAWWRSYRRFLVHQAVLAEHTGAELFAVGTELGGTLEREAEWRRAIAAVRRVYGGRLTYAANWHGDFDRVPFWDDLDLLGIDAYQPLAATADASPRQLAAGARTIARDLAAACRRHGKRVLLTEVGYAARRAAWTSPHEEGGEPSPRDQATAYRALFSGLGRPDWLAGLFVWKAFSDEAPGAAVSERPDFRFLGRPAEGAIRDAFRGRRAPLR